MDFERAAAYFKTEGRWRNHNMRKIKNATWLQRHLAPSDEHMPKYVLRLFGKEIIEYQPDRFEIHDRGWFAHTTFQRFNEFMPRGFSVHGASQRYLKDTKFKTVAVVNTPKGVFPYYMPMTFGYDGRYISIAIDGSPSEFPPSGKANDVLRRLNKYVDGYLDQWLLKRPDERALTKHNLVAELAESSRLLGDAVIADERYAHVLPWLGGISRADRIGSVPVSTICRILETDTYAAFSARQPDLHRFERQLKLGDLAPPHIPYVTLRKGLRNLLLSEFMLVLGFAADLEWNRRDT